FFLFVDNVTTVMDLFFSKGFHIHFTLLSWVTTLTCLRQVGIKGFVINIWILQCVQYSEKKIFSCNNHLCEYHNKTKCSLYLCQDRYHMYSFWIVNLFRKSNSFDTLWFNWSE
ncbi:hypothetical protein ACJX0J_020237, partial [Zea mays]